jgi:hypothetical protein
VPAPKGALVARPREIAFGYNPDRKVKGKDGQLYEATNRAVLENMCKGIKHYLGYTSQTITLTRTKESTRKTNRKSMCPKKHCAKELKQYFAKYYPEGIPPQAQQAITMARDMSCDEFPFAISAEGGDISRGVRFCIPSAENSWQGGVMSSSFSKASGIKVGEKFNVTLEGFDCRTMSPSKLSRRDANATEVGSGRCLVRSNTGSQCT